MGLVMALLASVSWGVSDFLGGLKTRTVALPVVLAISQSAGLVVVTGALLLHGQPLPPGVRLILISAGAGLASLTALGLVYAAIARGHVVIVAPIAAAGAVVPVAVGFLRGDAVAGTSLAGMVLTMAGALAAAWSPDGDRERRGRTAAAALAAGSALAMGGFMLLLNTASGTDPFWATELVRVVSWLLALGLLAGWRARSRGADPAVATTTGARRSFVPTLAILASVGVTDAAAELSFAAASRDGGQLGVISVLASLYPVVTVVLAIAVLKERARLVQTCGVVSALVGIVLLSAG
jgi:drug/metabolite transporter (DMT)-like permease